MKKFTVPGRKCICGCKRTFPVTRSDRRFFENACAVKYWKAREKANLPPELRDRKPGRPKKVAPTNEHH